MLRPLSAVICCIAGLGAASVSAALYTGVADGAGRPPSVLPAESLYPGVFFGDARDHLDAADSLTTILGAVNELADRRPTPERPQTIASLYGDSSKPDDGTPDTADEEAGSTLSVTIAGVNEAPIRVFTGADTSQILSQLFSGILDVNDRTFARRADRLARQTTPGRMSGGSGGSGGGAGIGSLSPNGDFLSESFLATQAVGSQPGWVGASPMANEIIEIPVPVEKEEGRSTGELLAFVLMLLNPYFYGALVLLLLFSVAWSVRSRFSSSESDL